MSDHATARRSWYRPMNGRRPDESHRVSTPLELLFDLCTVVAVAQAALALEGQLHHAHVWYGIGSFLMVFFAIWWAWMNFTWFASAYDTDDVPYRVVVLVQIAGSLVLAAGVGNAVENGDFTVITFGYLVMRLGTVAQWLRAAAGDPVHRSTALKYAAGITVVQAGWMLRLLLPDSLGVASFLVLVALDLAVPAFAERGNTTRYHPHHIAERYGLLTVIVLGEAVLAATVAVRTGIDESDSPGSFIGLGAAALVILFALWWLYFDQDTDTHRLAGLGSSLLWGYGHYFVYAAGAAVGAGLALSVTYDLEHAAPAAEGEHLLTSAIAAGAVTVPIAVYLLSLAALRLGALQDRRVRIVVPVAAVIVLACTFTGAPVHLAAGVLLLTVVAEVALTRTRVPS
ncbi:low temperature requirement protein A [Nakamurella sp. YIM 132087]|uniref:Low temperature requirement protein A n=1 Tax=Nakamurella alba TaxID=2665158 RepID=A0A7K1FH62_9ACTN|nr:low temperature requirement protein A [Nakamurella alba]MTD13410.1 low temperature requirement protein A [Nakamurella alba]